MLGNTLTLPLAGGNVVLTKNNQDNYSSEYGLRTPTLVWKALIRHSKVSANGYDRHNVEVTRITLKAGDVEEYYSKFYFVLEHKPGDTAVDVADAVADLAIATSNSFLNSLVQWES